MKTDRLLRPKPNTASRINAPYSRAIACLSVTTKEGKRQHAWRWVLLLCCLLPIESLASDICGQYGAAVVEISRNGEPVATFSVALADRPHRWRKGLMHCPALVPGTGMLFTYPTAGKRVFWMKNTIIELAIVFISADNRIRLIAHGQPGSLNRIHSPDNIQTVLEINFRESQHLAVGDRVEWQLNADIDTHAPVTAPDRIVDPQ